VAEAVSGYQRIVLLNSLVSRSASHAPPEHHAPVHAAEELLGIIEKRRQKKWATEYLGAEQDDESEDDRVSRGVGHNFVRLRHLRTEQHGSYPFVVMLFEYVDQSLRSFPVVHTVNFTGREIAGEAEERGAAAAHVVVRLPAAGAYDDRRYRCAIEAVHSVTRSHIERFLSRQLRRHAIAEDWRFSVVVPPKGRQKRATERDYRYNPKLELFADIGRKLEHASSEGKVLTHMTFTKRGEKQSIGRPTEVKHKEIYADVEYKVIASQGPAEPVARTGWINEIRENYKSLGFSEKLYYRHIKGVVLSGDVHQSLASAADLLMCQKELIAFNAPTDIARSATVPFAVSFPKLPDAALGIRDQRVEERTHLLRYKSK
jgi:hypothetical protein